MSVTTQTRGANVVKQLKFLQLEYNPVMERLVLTDRYLETYSVACFENGNEQCVDDCDRVFLKRQEFRRDQIVHNRIQHHECYLKLPTHLQELDFGVSAATMGDVYAAEGYYRCYEKFVKKQVRRMHNEVKMMDKELRVIKEQYNFKG